MTFDEVIDALGVTTTDFTLLMGPAGQSWVE
jgi:hypothetical protein